MIIGLGETILDIIFKDDKPSAAVPGGSTYNAIISLGRTGVPATIVTETGNDHVGDIIVVRTASRIYRWHSSMTGMMRATNFIRTTHTLA